MTDVVIYSKPGCHLCEIMKAQLEQLRLDRPFLLREINILNDPDDYDRFHEEIPVVFIAGRKAFKYRLDAKQFLNRLEHAERSNGPDAT